MNKRIATTVGAAVVGGALIAGAVPAMAAVTASSPPAGVSLHLNSSGQIADKGADVTVSFEVVCPAGFNGSLNSSVSERSGNGIANGFGYENFECTGVEQTVSLFVQASSKRFVTGSAGVSAQLFTYGDFFGGTNLDVSGSVQFVK